MDNKDFNLVKVNREFLADIFNCDVRTVQNYAQHNGMPRDDRGEYSLFECLIWYIKKIQKDYDELSNDNPLTRARIEAIELNNQKKKREAEKEAQSLVEVEEVNLAFATIMNVLILNLESIAPRLMKKLNGDSKTLATIREEITDYRNRVANTPLTFIEDEYSKVKQEQSN